MSLIGSKRMQQGVFEALAGMNRVLGSGGGSGLASFLPLAGSANALNGTRAATGYATVGTSIGFAASTTSTQTFLGLATIRVQSSGNSQPSCFWRLNVGGSLSQIAPLDGPYPTIPNTTITLFVVAYLSTGTYTAQIECSSPVGTATLVDGTINLFRLGG